MDYDIIDHHYTLIPGGLPLMIDKECVGGIGIGGRVGDQDSLTAQYVIDTFNQIIKEYRLWI